MAAPKLNTKGIGALLGNPTKLNQAIQENPKEVIRELATTVANIPLDQIHPNPNQPRTEFDKKALHELADSIKAHGIIQPVTVRRMQDKEYQIISGERRYRASLLAGLTEVPAYVRLANDQELLEMALIENIQREDLNAWEVAVSYGHLVKQFNMTHEQISQRVGKDRTTITNYLRLAKFENDADIKKGLIEGLISMGHARSLAGLEEVEYAFRNVLYKKIISEDLSVRAVETLIASYKESKAPKPPKADKKLPEHLRNIQDQFRSFFGAKVDFKRDESGKGQLVVKFGSDAELNRLIDLIEAKL
jgi:ParB family transcriptional regulator, chromosome partitioning protein